MTCPPVTAVADVGTDERITVQPERWKGFGPAVAVTVGTKEKLSGVLILARTCGRPGFAPAEIAALPGFAGQAAPTWPGTRRRAGQKFPSRPSRAY
ncbi:hypothetical protein EDD91_1377 [Streptomyces sp. KS 21]|nr:hypothetical protein EDD91_1377 [Streptomyces sp. KS 21]